MRLVVDTNIVIAALIRDSATRRLLIQPELELYCPAEMFEEIAEHELEIRSKAKISKDELERADLLVHKLVRQVEKSEYQDRIPLALGCIDDKDDAPFLACASFLSRRQDCGIWTNDAHFLAHEQKILTALGVRVWRTHELCRYFFEKIKE